MRLLHTTSAQGDFTLTDKLLDANIPRYTILSHTWAIGEVTFEDVATNLTLARTKAGFKKLQFCSKQTTKDGLEYFWVDTCCIRKSSDAELSESLNSMFRWYRNAEKCYVYLSDVSTEHKVASGQDKQASWERSFRDSRWWTRGWTLQELLAPSSVEFFSRKGTFLGDKASLEEQIHQASGIPISALRGSPLSSFSIDQRLGWAADRKTTREEDAAYCLLGIFDTSMPVIYGEGKHQAIKRLKQCIGPEVHECLRQLFVTDPRIDKIRIEDTKGGLLRDSYSWVVENETFKEWRDDPATCMLWVRGDPGKGKTMLLCGIIDTLAESQAETHSLSYFFCQGTDSRINNATAVLRGLLWFLVDQQPSLLPHVQQRFERSSSASDTFDGPNAWTELSEIFANVLRDPELKPCYLVIDALDECTVELSKLLDFVVKSSSISSNRVKWLVSSRNWPEIPERLDQVQSRATLCLELNESSISAAVRTFIQHKVAKLASEKKYNAELEAAVLDYLVLHSKNTYLWVALVCNNLRNISRRTVLSKLKSFPPGLGSVYDEMMRRIEESDESELCKQILAAITTVYRPISISELAVHVDLGTDFCDDEAEAFEEVAGLSSSFLIVKKSIIYFVHQSAKDYILEKVFTRVFSSGIEQTHYRLFVSSVQGMTKTLRRDIYDLGHLGYPIEDVNSPEPDPLAAMKYACSQWVNHFCDWHVKARALELTDAHEASLLVEQFMRTKFLNWVEALSLLRLIPEGIIAIAKLQDVLKSEQHMNALYEVVHDAYRVLTTSSSGLVAAPLQAYGSAIVFSPVNSIIRRYYQHNEPEWLSVDPPMRNEWSNCLHTLEGHSAPIKSTLFSTDSSLLALLLANDKVRIWHVTSGTSLAYITCDPFTACIAFSKSSDRVFSASTTGRIQVWDPRSGTLVHSLQCFDGSFQPLAFSPDASRLASHPMREVFKVWDTKTGHCLYSIQKPKPFGVGYWSDLRSKYRLARYKPHELVAFSADSSLLAYGLKDSIIIAGARCGTRKQVLEGHQAPLVSFAFSRNSSMIISTAVDRTIKFWNVGSGQCLRTNSIEEDDIYSVVSSHDSDLVATPGLKHVKIWDLESFQCLQTFDEADWFNYNGPSRSPGRFEVAYFCLDETSSNLSPEPMRHTNKPIPPYTHYLISPDLDQSRSSGDFKHIDLQKSEDGEYRWRLDCGRKCVSTGFYPDASWQMPTHWRRISPDGFHHCYRWIVVAAFTSRSFLIPEVTDERLARVLTTECGHLPSNAELMATPPFLNLGFSPESSLLVTSTSVQAEEVDVWDLESQQRVQTLSLTSPISGGHCDTSSLEPLLDATPMAAAFSSDLTGFSVVSPDTDAEIYLLTLWSSITGACLRSLSFESHRYSDFFVYSSDLARLATYIESDGISGTIEIWDLRSGQRQVAFQPQHASRSSGCNMAFSTNSRQLACAITGTVGIYSTEDGSLIHILEDYIRNLGGLSFSHDSTLVASTGAERAVAKLWKIDPNVKYQPGQLECCNGAVEFLRLSADSTRLLSVHDDYVLKVWDVTNGMCVQSLAGHAEAVRWADFYENSSHVLSCTVDCNVRLWSVATGACLRTVNYPQGKYSHKSLAVCNVLRQFARENTPGTWPPNFSYDRDGYGHLFPATCIKFSPDSRFLASAHSDGTVWTWDSANAKQHILGKGHGCPYSVSLVFSHEQSKSCYLATGHEDGSMRTWDMTSGELVETFPRETSPREAGAIVIHTYLRGQYIRADKGTIDIPTWDKMMAFQPPPFGGPGISADPRWITYDSRKILWLPVDFRGHNKMSVICTGSVVAIGTGSGKVRWFRMSPPGGSL